jgi:hypothetical protein
VRATKIVDSSNKNGWEIWLSSLSFPSNVGARVVEFLLKSLERVSIIGTSLLGWYLFIFGCLWGVDIPEYSDFSFYRQFISTNHSYLSFVCNLFYRISIPHMIHKISCSNQFFQKTRTFSGVSIALKQDLLYHKVLGSCLLKLLFLFVYVFYYG